jgi:hypothetical protein
MLLLSGGKSAEAAGGASRSTEAKISEAKDLNTRPREAAGE